MLPHSVSGTAVVGVLGRLECIRAIFGLPAFTGIVSLHHVTTSYCDQVSKTKRRLQQQASGVFLGVFFGGQASCLFGLRVRIKFKI
eukprot:scaffold136272_cov23-Cyclotella_meneghiniana.AAC.2